MSRMVIELSDSDSVQTVIRALEACKVRLRACITRTMCRLAAEWLMASRHRG
jgi:hypothetical protein